jgi:hypothetical protein
LSMKASLDGLVARPGRRGWRPPAEDAALQRASSGRRGLHLLGRSAYDEMTEFWPVLNDSYAAPMSETPRVACSRMQERAECADMQTVRGDLAQKVATLKPEPRRACSSQAHRGLRPTPPARRCTSTGRGLAVHWGTLRLSTRASGGTHATFTRSMTTLDLAIRTASCYTRPLLPFASGAATSAMETRAHHIGAGITLDASATPDAFVTRRPIEVSPDALVFPTAANVSELDHAAPR